jgi:hypothetical protein
MRLQSFNHPKIFAATPLRRLLIGYTVLRFCSLPWLVNPLVAWLRRSSAARAGSLLDPSVWVSRRLVFPHFCAGEALEDVARARADMGGVPVLLDHSVEEGESELDWETNLANKKELLRRCEEIGGVVGVPIKPTSLVSPLLLEKLTRSIVAAEGEGEDAAVERALAADASLRRAFDGADRNLAALCAEALRIRVPLLLDAEQSHRQPAIDVFAQRLQARFNGGEDGFATVSNTYQMYLTDAPRRLARDLQRAERGGYTFGAKLVRGAYLLDERQRESLPGATVLRRKEDVDEAYDAASVAVLASIAQSRASEGRAPRLLLATHNRDSVRAAAEEAERLAIAADDPSLNFAQIMGMADNVTYALMGGGYNASKLVLFGDFAQVFPWLLRRIDENRDMLSAASQQREADLLAEEARRRMGFTPRPQD